MPAVGLHHFPAAVDPGEVSDHLRRFGYAIVDDVADPALLDRLEAEAMPCIEASAAGRDEYDGRFTRRTGALVARCPSVRPLVMHPLVVGAVSHFLGHASAVQLHLTQIISVEPGETRQKLHRDEMAFDFFPFGPDYHVQCNTMWALTDFTAANGATWILPGTSGSDDEAARGVAGAQAEMGRGSVLFYEGKVLHGAGANTSGGVRRGVNITYAVGWVRQEENQYLACPPEVARTLDDDLLRMMGYTQGAFALGYVGDQTDPLAALRGGSAKAKTIGATAEHSPHAKRFVADIEDV
jgi:ectoine hydroxylase-related dioxygenase (phytanoyl-CoA dioxygenase family)